MQTIQLGDHGPAVIEIRAALQQLRLLPTGAAALDPSDPNNAVFDGACSLAVAQFQQQRSLDSTGQVDPETYRELIGARFSLGDRILFHRPASLMRGDDVRTLQQRLSELGYHTGNLDGIFGTVTARALATFQRDYGLSSDAVFGPDTARSLSFLAPRVVGGSAASLRSRANRLASGPHLTGKLIALDPALTQVDVGVADDLVWDITARVREHLEIMGAEPLLARDRGTFPSVAHRADVANSRQAALFISLHVTRHSSPQAEGLATYYFGTSERDSPVGHEFAGLLHREIASRTPFVDLGVHARVFEILRLTAMPAVHVEIGYLTNPHDRRRLGDAQIRADIAEGIVAAVQRFYLPEDREFPTGTWTFPPAHRGATQRRQSDTA